MPKKKPHGLKGRKRSPEAIAKSIATRQARLAAKNGSGVDADSVRDALTFLRKARKKMRSENRELEDVELYTLCALRCLEGGFK